MADQDKPELMRSRGVAIIDDEPAFVETLTKMLTSLNYEMAVSTDSRASSTFDITDDYIVFLDVQAFLGNDLLLSWLNRR